MRRAQEIAAATGNRAGEAKALGNLGSLYGQHGDVAQAEDCYNRSVAILRELGDHESAEAVLKALSDLTLKRGNWLDSFLHYDRKLAISPSPTSGKSSRSGWPVRLKRLIGL